MAPPNYVKIFVSKISADIKTNWHPSWAIQTFDFWGIHLGGPPGGWHFQTIPKYLSVKYLLIS